MVPVSGVFEQGPGFWSNLAQWAAAVSLWASAKAQQAREREFVEDLAERLRHPVRWRVRHPIQALRLIPKRDRRRSR